MSDAVVIGQLTTALLSTPKLLLAHKFGPFTALEDAPRALGEVCTVVHLWGNASGPKP